MTEDMLIAMANSVEMGKIRTRIVGDIGHRMEEHANTMAAEGANY